MPAGDRTGPAGMGPMTGRGAGYCAGYNVPGWANPVPGRGLGMGGAWGGPSGRGRGQRHRYCFYATGVPGWARFGYGPYAAAPTREQEREVLQQQAEWLKQQLDAIGQRIEELGKEE